MKLQSVQILRGVAAWMIVVYHFMKHFGYTQRDNALHAYFGQFGVDIFFVISGFIMALILSTREGNTKDFIVNRLVRVVPNYWFWTMAILIVGFLIKDSNILQVTPSSVFMSLFFITHDNPSDTLDYYPVLAVGWTLNMEMFFYVLIALMLLFKFSSRKTLFIVAFTLPTLVVFYKVFHIEFYNEVMGNARLLEFMFGIMLYVLWKDYSRLFFSPYFIFLSFILTIIVFVVPSPDTLKLISLAVLLVYLALLLNTSLNTKNVFVKALIYLGEISYSTYLLHMIVILIMVYCVGEITSLLAFFCVFFTVIISTFLLSVISHKIIEKDLSFFLKRLCVTKNETKIRYHSEKILVSEHITIKNKDVN